MMVMMMMMMHRRLQVQGHGHGMILISMLMYIIAFLKVIDYLLGRLHVRHKRCLQLQSGNREKINEYNESNMIGNDGKLCLCLLTLDVRFMKV